MQGALPPEREQKKARRAGAKTQKPGALHPEREQKKSEMGGGGGSMNGRSGVGCDYLF